MNETGHTLAAGYYYALAGALALASAMCWAITLHRVIRAVMRRPVRAA